MAAAHRPLSGRALQDECRSTHSETAIEYDTSRSRAEWSRNLVSEDRRKK